MTIKDAIANAFITKLNANSKSKLFSVAIDMKQETGERMEYYSYPDKFNVDIKKYIPASMNFQDTPANLPNIDKTTWGIILEYGIATTNGQDTQFEDSKEAIEEMRLFYVNNPTFTVEANGTTYNCVCSMTSLRRGGAIQKPNGFKRVLMNMGISVVSGIGLQFGNNTTVEIRKQGDITWLPTSFTAKQIGNAIDYTPTQNSAQTSVKSVPDSTLWTMNSSLTFNESLTGDQELYTIAVNNPDFEQVYEARITPSYGNQFTKDVNIQGNLTSNLGVDEKINIVFTEV